MTARRDTHPGSAVGLATQLVGGPAGSALLIIGGIGSGRSTLARAIAAVPPASTCGFLSARPGSAAPLRLARELIRLVADFTGADVGRPATDVPQAIRQLRQVLTGRQPADRLLLVIDDVHLADPASADVLADLLRAPKARRPRLALTARADWPAVVPGPLAECLMDLSRHTLAPLTTDDLTIDAVTILGAPPAAPVAADLLAATGGNPAALHGVLANAVAQGAVVVIDERAWLRPQHRLALPADHLLPHRVAELPGVAAQVAGLLAVAGPCPSADLVAALELSTMEAESAVTTLRAVGLLRASDGDLAIPVLSDALAARMAPWRRSAAQAAVLAAGPAGGLVGVAAQVTAQGRTLRPAQLRALLDADADTDAVAAELLPWCGAIPSADIVTPAIRYWARVGDWSSIAALPIEAVPASAALDRVRASLLTTGQVTALSDVDKLARHLDADTTESLRAELLGFAAASEMSVVAPDHPILSTDDAVRVAWEQGRWEDVLAQAVTDRLTGRTAHTLTTANESAAFAADIWLRRGRPELARHWLDDGPPLPENAAPRPLADWARAGFDLLSRPQSAVDRMTETLAWLTDNQHTRHRALVVLRLAAALTATDHAAAATANLATLLATPPETEEVVDGGDAGDVEAGDESRADAEELPAAPGAPGAPGPEASAAPATAADPTVAGAAIAADPSIAAGAAIATDAAIAADLTTATDSTTSTGPSTVADPAIATDPTANSADPPTVAGQANPGGAAVVADPAASADSAGSARDGDRLAYLAGTVALAGQSGAAIDADLITEYLALARARHAAFDVASAQLALGARTRNPELVLAAAAGFGELGATLWQLRAGSVASELGVEPLPPVRAAAVDELVADLVAVGLTNADIAGLLGRTEMFVKRQVSRLLRATNSRRRTELIAQIRQPSGPPVDATPADPVAALLAAGPVAILVGPAGLGRGSVLLRLRKTLTSADLTSTVVLRVNGLMAQRERCGVAGAVLARLDAAVSGAASSARAVLAGNDRLAAVEAAVTALRTVSRSRPVVLLIDDADGLPAADRVPVSILAAAATGRCRVVLAASRPWPDLADLVGVPVRLPAWGLAETAAAIARRSQSMAATGDLRHDLPRRLPTPAPGADRTLSTSAPAADRDAPTSASPNDAPQTAAADRPATSSDIAQPATSDVTTTPNAAANSAIPATVGNNAADDRGPATNGDGAVEPGETDFVRESATTVNVAERGIDEETVAAVARRTGGDPGALFALLRGVDDGGDLGAALRTGVIDPGAVPQLRELVGPGAEVARCAALLAGLPGPRVPAVLPALASVGIGGETVYAVADRLLDSGLCSATADGLLRFLIPLFGESLTATADRDELRAVHAFLAKAMLADRDNGIPVEFETLAEHIVGAGATIGQRELVEFAERLAGSQPRRVERWCVALLAAEPEDAVLAGRAAAICAHVRYELTDFAGAVPVARQALDLLSDLDTADESLDARTTLINSLLRIGNYAAALGVTTGGGEAPRSVPDGLQQARILLLRQRFDEALSVLSGLRPENQQLRVALITGVRMLAAIGADGGAWQNAESHTAPELSPLAPEQVDTVRQALAWGDLYTAERAIMPANLPSPAVRRRPPPSMDRLANAAAAFREGRWSTVLDLHAENAEADTEKTYVDGLLPALAAEVLLRQGQLAEAEKLLVPTSAEQPFGHLIGWANAGLRLLRGETAEAVAELAETDRRCRRLGYLTGRELLLGRRVDACLVAGDREAAVAASRELTELAGRVNTRQAALYALVGQLAAAPDAHAARTALRVADQYGDRFLAARVRLHTAEFERDDAALRAAFAEFRQLGAVNWQRRAGELLAARGMSTRVAATISAGDRQLIELIAAGATNQEAAAEMGVGEKAVEARLTRLYRRTGLRSRAELVREYGSGATQRVTA